MKNQLYFILILLLLSFKVNAQKTKLIFVQSLKVNYSENPIYSNKPFSFKLLKNKKCILKNNRADTLHHFSFDLDTLTAISFEFNSDTILIPNAREYFGDTGYVDINLTPNNKTNCIKGQFYLDIRGELLISEYELTNAECRAYKYILTNYTEQIPKYIMDNYEYIKLR